MATTAKAAEKPEPTVSIREMLQVTPPAESITWINKLVYGEPGAGKTYLLGTAADHPETAPLLFLDIEGGIMTIRDRQDIDVVQVRSMKQLQDIINMIAKQPKPLYYKTIGVDGITELQKLDMRTVMMEQFNRKPETTDIYVPSQREWGKSGERVRMIVRALRDLECNLIMTALQAEFVDERTGRRLIHPSIPGKLKSEIPGFFDIVGHLKAVHEGGEIIRTLQTVKTESLIAKDRSDSLPPLMKNPSIPEIWDIVHGNSNSKSESK